MITSTRRILIVPDFGVSAEAEDMVALKKAIDRLYNCTAKIVDLPKMVTDEHPGKTLKMPELIRLCAKKLEALASDETLEWNKDEMDFDFGDYDDFFRRIDLAGLDSRKEDEEIIPERKAEDTQAIKPETVPAEQPSGIRKLKITKSISKRTHKPSVLVVFGRSAMLAGAIERCPILFINPEYDAEWPWKREYYADREAAEKFYDAFIEEAELDRTQSQLAVAFDDYGAPRWKQPERIGLFFDGDNVAIEEFDRLYPNLAMSDPDLCDPSKLAEAIREFCEKKIETPRFDIDRLLLIPARRNMDEALTITLPRPVELRDGRKILAVEKEAPSPYRMTGTVVYLKGTPGTQPLGSIRDRRDLAALRDSLREAVSLMPARKKILIVEDCLSPSPSPCAERLSKALQTYGHYVPVMLQGSRLKDSRDSLERRCRRKHFDAVVTLQTGCLLASRITDTHRIFINPHWKVWEEMKQFDYYRTEWEMARKMSRKEYIRRYSDHWAMGWFTVDMFDSDEAKEHTVRFGDAAYPPHADLTTETGIRALARQIHNILL